MIQNFAAEQSASGISSLGLNLKAFIFQLITFVIIMWLLNKFALSKIFATIDKRRNELNESLKAAEKTKEVLAETEAKVDGILDDARNQADQIVAASKKEAAVVVKDSEVKAEQKAERMLAESRKQLEQDVIKARSELKKETASLVAKAASVVINEKLDGVTDQKLIVKSLEEVAK